MFHLLSAIFYVHSVQCAFYLEKRNTYKSGPAPIYLRISVDGQRTEDSVGRECDPSRWNSHAGRATGNKEDVRALNTFLDSVQSKLNVVSP
ncbi:MAG: Arm DNA-binding domain-containing protein [Arcticibacter sp.]